MVTKWGNVHFHYSRSGKSYYKTYPSNKKYPNKYLHRLIFEDFYGEIPEGYHVHHIDGNSLNNCILNKGYHLPIGMFHEWVSCEIINNLIDDALE